MLDPEIEMVAIDPVGHVPRCRDLWASVIKVYVLDACNYARKGHADDGGQAWLDFNTDRQMINHLADALDLDANAVARYVALELAAVR